MRSNLVSCPLPLVSQFKNYSFPVDKDLWNGRYLVALIIRFHLSENQCVLLCPSTDHVYGCFLIESVIGASDPLPINCYHFTLHFYRVVGHARDFVHIFKILPVNRSSSHAFVVFGYRDVVHFGYGCLGLMHQTLNANSSLRYWFLQLQQTH
jgi:hypothetical protein